MVDDEHADELEPTVPLGGEEGTSPSESVPRIEGYEITGRLGQGGMGVVWRAYQLSTHREVALKLLPAGEFATERSRRRFEREVELAAALEHPSIARVYDSGLRRGVYYYAMELIDGVRLDRYVSERSVSKRETLELMRKVCQAVQHAHQHGVIHRDLKPSNILVTDDGTPHVLDFGLAKSLLSAGPEPTVSLDGHITGTLAYMSPEQAAGRPDQIDTRTDVYSLGVILYELLTGQPPHDLSGLRLAVLRRIAEEDVRRPRDLTHTVDRELEALLLTALSRDAEKRYASAGDLAQDIGNYLAGDPLVAKKPTTTYFLLKRIRKHRVRVAASALVVLALAGMAVFSAVRITAERDAARKESEARRRVLYFNRIALANAELRQGNVAHAEELLELCPEDLRGWEWHRLRHTRDVSIRTLHGHSDRVNAVAFSPDGRTVVSGSSDKSVKIWRADTGELLRTFSGHEGGVLSVALSGDGARVASGDEHGIVRIWEASTGSVVGTLENCGGAVADLTFDASGAQLATASADGAMVWELDSFRKRPGFAYLGRGVTSVAFSPDGRRLAAGADKGIIWICDLTTGERVGGRRPGWLTAASLRFSPDNKQLIVCGRRGTTAAWDAQTGVRTGTLLEELSEAGFSSVVLSPDHKHVATAQYTVNVVDIDTRRTRATRHGHREAIVSLAWSPDGKTIVSGSRDSTVKLWSSGLAPWVPSPLEASGEAVFDIDYNPDGRLLVSGGLNGTLQVWSTAAEKLVMRRKTDRGRIMAAGFSPDGKRVYAGSEDGTVVFWDIASGEEASKLRADNGTMCSLGFDSQRKRILTVNEDKGPTIRDASTGTEIMALRAPETGVSEADFSSDGSRVVAFDGNGTVHLWDAATGKPMRSFKPDVGRIWSIGFTPDDRSIVIAGTPDLTIWDVAAGTRVLTLRGHQAGVTSFAYSPDGRRIVSGSFDRTLRVWDALTGAEALTLGCRKGVIYAVAFSPDGRDIVVGANGGLQIWSSGPHEDDDAPPATGEALLDRDEEAFVQRCISAHALVATGESHVASKEYDLAIRDCDNAIALWSGCERAYATRGVAYELKGEYDRALRDLDRAIALNSGSAETCRTRGVVYFCKGEYDRAVTEFGQAIALKPDEAEPYLQRGEAYGRQGEYDLAIRDFNKAIALRPDAAVFYMKRGVACVFKREYDRAIANFDKAVALDPDLLVAYWNRGLVHMEKHDSDRALRDFGKVVALDPGHEKAHLYRALILVGKGELDRAIRDLDQLISLRPDSAEAYATRGYVYALKHEYDLAISDCDKAITLKPDFHEAYLNRAAAHYQKGRYDKAWADVQKCRELGGEVEPEFVAKLKKALNETD